VESYVDAAEPLLVEAVAVFERVLGPEHDRVASAANNLAALYHYGRGDLERAEPLYRRAVAIDRARLLAGHICTAQVLVNLGTLLCEKGQWDEGRPMFDEGISQMAKVSGADLSELRRARARMARSPSVLQPAGSAGFRFRSAVRTGRGSCRSWC
jgi:tetratricopeptide (TPR) repeat protein